MGFNLSTKNAYSNQTLGKIVLTEKDVIALYDGLRNGWQEKLAENEKLRTELKNYKSFLGGIGNLLGSYLNFSSKFEKPDKTIKRFEKILADIKTFMKK